MYKRYVELINVPFCVFIRINIMKKKVFVNLDYLEELAGSDAPEKIQEWLLMGAQLLPQRWEDMALSFEQDDVQALQMATHKYRSTAQFLGLSIAPVLKRIESELRAGTPMEKLKATLTAAEWMTKESIARLQQLTQAQAA